MKMKSKLHSHILLTSLSIAGFFLFLIYFFSYLPAIKSYREIEKNLIGATFTIASMATSCEGMNSAPKTEKSKEPYKQSLASDDKKLLQYQTALYTSITLGHPYIDRITEKKLKEFLKWNQDQQYSIMINNSCTQLNTSFDNLMKWSIRPMSLVPYSFKDYVIYYIKKNWLNAFS